MLTFDGAGRDPPGNGNFLVAVSVHKMSLIHGDQASVGRYSG